MPAALSALLNSPLAERYRFDVIPTYRDAQPLRRLWLFGRSLLALVSWSVGPGRRIVHVHMAARGSMYRKALVVAVAKATRRPVVLQLHAGPGDLAEFLDKLGSLRRFLLRRALVAPDVLLSVSASSADVLRDFVDAPVMVVPNSPPPISVPAPRPLRWEMTVLFLGGFANRAKGGNVLLEAIPSILERCSNVQIVLAGPGSGPTMLPERARWRGWLQPAEREEAFSGADAFVMPSLSEGMPIALLEAMANGLPIIATRVGGMSEILTNGVDAIIVDPDDPAALSRAVTDLAADPELRQRLSGAALERVRRLAEDDVYGELDHIYASVLRR